MSAAWLTALSSLLLVVVSVLAWGASRFWKITARFIRFLDDYFGEPARPGVPERLGVMARLQAVEAAAARAEEAAAKVLAETQPNGGHSLRDVVHRTAEDVTRIKEVQRSIQQRMEEIDRQEGPPRG